MPTEMSVLSATIKNYRCSVTLTDFGPQYAPLDSNMQGGVLNGAGALHNTSAV
jgi:hypothetical protein